MNKVVKNYLYNVIYQIITIVTPLVTAPYLVRVLGAEKMGMFGFAHSIVTYFILVGTVGSSLYGQREIAYVQDKRNDRTVIFKEIIFFRICTLITAGGAYVVFVFCQMEYINISLILLLEILANIFDISWFYQGMQEFRKIVWRNLIIKGLSIIAIFLFVRKEEDIVLYALWYVVPILIGNFSLWISLPKYICDIKVKNIFPYKRLKAILILFLPQVAIDIYTVLDKTMIGLLGRGMEEVGYYEQIQNLIKVGTRLLTALGSVMLSKISMDFMNGKKEDIQKSIENAFRFVFVFGSAIVFGIVGISSNFIPLYYGIDFEKTIILLVAMAPIILFVGVSNIIGVQYLLPTKQQKIYTISVIMGALINFSLNLLLIKHFNAIGAGIASVIAEMSVTSFQVFSVRKKLPVVKYIKSNIKYLFMGAFMGIIVYKFGRNTKSVRMLVLQIFVGIIVYCMGIIFINRHMCSKVLKEMKQRYNNNM